jgi:GAF domain-containing protein
VIAPADRSRDFAQLGVRFSAQADLAMTLACIVTLAQAALAGSGAAIWSLTDRKTVRVSAATDPALMLSSETWLAQRREGPMWEAAIGQITVSCPDLTTETRWPAFAADVVAATSVRSTVALPLLFESQNFGILTIYSDLAGHITPTLVETGEILATHAGIAIRNATIGERTAHLELALKSNRRIGMAMGILMAGMKLTEQQGFDLLRQASQRANRKLLEVAEEVILTGLLPLEAAQSTNPH